MPYYPQQPQQYPAQPPYAPPVQPYPPYPGQPYVQQPYGQQPYVQQPVQQPYGQPVPQYPPYPGQLYVPPVQPTAPQRTPEEQKEYDYRRKLKRSAISIGTLLLIFLGLQAVIALFLSGILSAVGLEDEASEGSALFLLENGVISAMIFFLSGLIYCLIKRLDLARLFPFKKVSGVMLLKLSVIGLSFSLMSNYVVNMLSTTFGLFGIENGGGSIDAGAEPNVLLYFLTVAILPAFAEEFAFRGIIMGSLKPYSEGLAILVSSATFALMHGNFVQLPFTFCCGIVFAYIDIKSGSLLPSIIVHFLNNGLSVLSDILLSYNILNEAGVNFFYGAIFAVTGILSLIFLRGMINKGDGRFFRLQGGSDDLAFKEKVKTVCKAPTLIVFTVLMLITCVAYLFIV